jgi:hypothetical protein
MNHIQEAIRQLRVGRGLTFRELTVFPLNGPGRLGLDYLPLVQALHQDPDAFIVRELPDGGAVPEIEVVNGLDVPVLIIEGQELVGAQQHRTANLTVLVPPKSTIRLNVSCVEAGRWAQATERFMAAKHAQFASGRARKVASVSYSMRSSGRAYSDQSGVWSDISEKLCSLGVDSPTSAMGDLFERHAPTLDGYVDAFQAMPDCHGAAFAVRDRVIGLDLFGDTSGFKAYKEQLLRGYAVEALGMGDDTVATRAPERNRVSFLLRDVAAGEVEGYPAVGMGEDVRIAGQRTVAGALAVEGEIVHLAAFPRKRGEEGMRRARRYGAVGE